MYVLGIETSCDETAASIVKNGGIILSNIIASSLKEHKKYGGIVPEVAFRMQLETITAVVDCAVKKAGITLKDINLVSVTSGPGLLGSLLVGISFAKALSLGLEISLLGINHLHSHIYAGLLNPPPETPGLKSGKERGFIQRGREPWPSGRGGSTKTHLPFPFVALVVSGGHTSLFYVKDFDKIEIQGETSDDACGEAFDKVAKILGLGYPGGPLIERLAKYGNPKKIKFSCSQTKQPLDFSFSGIKTAVLYYVRKLPSSPVIRLENRQTGRQADRQTADIAASFQETIINTLIEKSLLACKLKKANTLVVGGGVAANQRLRERFYDAADNNNLSICFPPKEFCTDNAVMVAGLGYRLFKKGYRSNLELSVNLN